MRILSALLLLSLLVACGQTGDLYLPDDKPAAVEQDKTKKKK